MAEDKPMTVKERMAALARASSGGDSASTPPKAVSTSAGPSVAERLAKMRAGPGRGDSVLGGSPTSANKPGLVRTFTPPTSAPTVVTRSPGGGRGPSKSGGSSSIADKIAALSGSGNSKSSALPSSPSAGPPASSTPPAAGKVASAGGGSNDSGGGNVSDAKGGDSPRVSSGLAARMEAMKLSSSSTSSNGGSSEKNGTAVEYASSKSGSKISPGLAAHMGKAIPIPMPGGEPRGGKDGLVCCVFHSSLRVLSRVL
ncbi:unnamed protein product [Pylaiella littoralis]